MNSVALRILLGDRAKYVGLIFGIAFSTMLMSNQLDFPRADVADREPDPRRPGS